MGCVILIRECQAYHWRLMFTHVKVLVLVKISLIKVLHREELKKMMRCKNVKIILK